MICEHPERENEDSWRTRTATGMKGCGVMTTERTSSGPEAWITFPANPPEYHFWMWYSPEVMLAIVAYEYRYVGCRCYLDTPHRRGLYTHRPFVPRSLTSTILRWNLHTAPRVNSSQGSHRGVGQCPFREPEAGLATEPRRALPRPCLRGAGTLR